MAPPAAPRVVASATRSYYEFLWQTTFGLLTVLAAPFLAATAIVLGLGKSLHDVLRTKPRLAA